MVLKAACDKSVGSDERVHVAEEREIVPLRDYPSGYAANLQRQSNQRIVNREPDFVALQRRIAGAADEEPHVNRAGEILSPSLSDSLVASTRHVALATFDSYKQSHEYKSGCSRLIC